MSTFFKLFVIFPFESKYVLPFVAAHPWLRKDQSSIPLDILVYKLITSYFCVTPLKRAALKVHVI